MTLDPTSDIGKLRLRVADYSDLPYLPDAVYQATLNDNAGNLPTTARVLATYILGMLAHKTHRRMNQLEVWGAEAFENYRKFLLLTVKDPAFMSISPIPYGASTTTLHPLLQFSKDWNLNYVAGTQSDQLNLDAIGGGLTSDPSRIDL